MNQSHLMFTCNLYTTKSYLILLMKIYNYVWGVLFIITCLVFELNVVIGIEVGWLSMEDVYELCVFT